MRVKYALLVIALGALVTGSIGLERGAIASTGGPAATALTNVAPAQVQATAPEERTGQVVVKFRRTATLGDVGNALANADAQATASTAGSGLVLVSPDPGQTDDEAIASLRARGDVEFAEPNHVVHIAATPTDPLYASNQWNLPQIGLPTAWNTSTGSASVIIAVVDTGVDASHPDLAGKITTGANAGYNFVANNTTTTDDHFHGTFVASIIAANTNNGQGGAGVCWACKIMPVKVLDSTGSGSTFNVAQGVDWAVAHGANVINMSLGSSSPDSGLQTSVDNAWNAGVIVVAASGNNNGPVLYPAAYPNVIAVGSNNSAGVKSSFSNFGPELDVMAPGENVFGALCTCGAYTGGYGTGSGTSFASPHVAGVVGLLISAGITDKNTIRTKLQTTATDMDVAGFDNNTGWGRVNAAAAIASSGTSTPTATVTRTSTTTPTPTRTNTPIPATSTRTNTATPTRTNTPIPPTSTRTNTATPTRTNTPVPATSTPTNTGTSSPTNTATSSPTPTYTPTPPVYGVSWGSDTTGAALVAGSTNSESISFTNTASLTWPASGANAVRLGYHWRRGPCPGTSIAVWDSGHTSLASDVSQSGTVSGLAFSLIAPTTAGNYCLQYDLVQEGVTWFSWQGATMLTKTVSITSPAYVVQWGADTTPATMAVGSNNPVTVTFTNQGSLTWASTGANAVVLSYHWRRGACPGTSIAVSNGQTAALTSDVATGGTVTDLAESVLAPATAGAYCLQYDLLQTAITWFSWQGASTLNVTVTVS
jgi:subtilisin family serine protease